MVQLDDNENTSMRYLPKLSGISPKQGSPDIMGSPETLSRWCPIRGLNILDILHGLEDFWTLRIWTVCQGERPRS